MQRIFFKVAYDGTDYAGWQIQPDNVSIQQFIESRLEQLYVNQPVRIHASGRTDSGVHAVAQTVTFDPPECPHIPLENLQIALNHSLPDAIRIKETQFADAPDFHARYSAKGKAYTYVINRGRKTPFNAPYSWHLPDCRDICEIRKVAMILEGEHDFSAFTTSRKKIDNAVRTIYKIDIQEFDDFLTITCVGSGFLYKMVRNIAGLLTATGRGTINAEFTKEILKSKDRSIAPESAPPNGLFLMEVFYEKNAWKKFQLDKLPFG
jgi:tRNA pseudouridine38-40 synthase